MVLRVVFTSFIFALLACAQATDQNVSRVGFSSMRIEVNAASVEGDAVIDVGLSQLDVLRSSGDKERGNLTVIYDPRNRFYVSTFQLPRDPLDMSGIATDLESGAAMVFVSPSGIFLFRMATDVSILKGANQANSLGDAERQATDEIRRDFKALEKGSFDNNSFTNIPVSGKISKSFACDPDPMYRPDCEFGIKKFVSIAREGEDWKLVVRNRWDQEIVLDSKFDLVSTTPLPPHS